ncbi:hypothetical protein TrRE_jg10582 [Triparma retinervis]|uniref:EF-hand domain-containing protein n=1 Tax=Triparma retinervis TaxID=2557542 RepID=A0A9W7F8Q7_9STRA|nr:hypothetical protein TrRE_jg10582 [Triparma retinervis]
MSPGDEDVEALLAKAEELRKEAASIEAARAAEKAQQVQAVFAKFDTNDDGVVSYEELVDGLKKQFKADSLDEAAVKRLFSDLDKDGNDVIDASEFKLSIREMGTRIESYIREEKDNQRQAAMEAKEAREAAEKAEARLAFLNEQPPTTADKVYSILPYLFPLLDGLQYGRFLLQGEDNPVINSVALLYVIYRNIPFSGFIAFFAINFLSNNPKLNRLIRWNLSQAIWVDIALIVPGLLGGIGKAGLPALGVQVPPVLGEVLDDSVFFCLIAVLLYCAGSSLAGREPGGIPFVSRQVKERMPTIEMFNDEGRFVGRQREGKEEGDKDEK